MKISHKVLMIFGMAMLVGDFANSVATACKEGQVGEARKTREKHGGSS